MDRRDVPLLLRDLQLLVGLPLIRYSVLLEGLVHDQGFTIALPGVAAGVEVYLLVAIQYLVDGLLGRYFQHILRLGQRIDDLDPSAAFGELPHIVLLVFPPRYQELVLLDTWLGQIQVSPLRAVIFFLPIRCYALPRLLGFLIEPVGDVCACRFNQRPHFLHYF